MTARVGVLAITGFARELAADHFARLRKMICTGSGTMTEDLPTPQFFVCIKQDEVHGPLVRIGHGDNDRESRISAERITIEISLKGTYAAEKE